MTPSNPPVTQRAKIHVVPRVSTWKEVTVAQAPWLPVRRLESPLEPDLTLLSLVIGTNSPCAVSLRLALPQNCWKGISDWTKLSRSLQPSEVGISLFAKPRDGGKLSPSHPRCLLRLYLVSKEDGIQGNLPITFSFAERQALAPAETV